MHKVQEMQNPGAMAVASGVKQNVKADASTAIHYSSSAPSASAPAARECSIMVREYIHECLGFAMVHAGLAQTYAELGDDAGLEYALRNFAAYARQAAGSFNDLRKIAADRKRLDAAEVG